ncbi:MAG: diguanylate cyclase [Alphaproteobacteria bacterium]|nr:diguanylate cyclase [Alphaproteobacteria bacterium]
MQQDDKTEADMAVLVRLFARVPIALAINLACALGTVTALWPDATPSALMGWLGSMVLVLWVRFSGWRRFQRRADRVDQVRVWRHRFTLGAAATGLAWGFTAFVFYTPQSDIAQTFLPFIVAGMVGGSLLTLAGSLPAFGAFLMSAMLPYMLRFVLLGDTTHLIMAGMIVIYMVGLIALMRPMCLSLVSSVHLASMNDRLISQLKEKSSQLQATFDHINQGVAVFDHLGRLLTWNPRHRELHGYPLHLYRPGTHLRQFLDQDLAHSEQPGDGELDPRALAEPLAPVRFQQSGAEGRTLAVERSSMPGGGFVSTSTDITDHKRVEARMLHLAQHDPLTDLPNRLLFQDRLQQAMARSTRTGSPIGVIVMDLDGFKEINDSAGHRVGDEALKALARRLRSGLRESDTVARIGGDEFAFILPDLTTPTAAVRIGEKILASIETPLEVEEGYIDLRVSLGIAMFPSDAEHAEALMQYADLAMYRAKRAGGSSISLAGDLQRRRRSPAAIERKSPTKVVSG